MVTSKARKPLEDKIEGAERSPLLGSARKVLLAGIGAVALAQDEAEDFVNRLVERGEIAEADGKKLIRDVLDWRKKEAKKVAGGLDQRIEEALDRMNIPTKAEIEMLREKIAELAKKIDELKQT
ncbi:MAG: poly(hydroxyalkanoate) granule-associated protein [Chloroflexi bacterium HGW-Chloroflexi-1]|nr:MAG: poly(hydroxyalkanoate) granule-associated protein [Chloroflexi bacterium HGW-Chloroflexi-1]